MSTPRAPESANESAELDPSDPYLRSAQTFPTLSADMLERAAVFGEAIALAKGERLFSRGDRGVDFYIVLEGAVEIYDVNEHDAEALVHLHEAHEFTGELTLFSNRSALVSARARDATRVVRIKPADFRRLVSAESDIGEVIMRAFILRRVGLIRHTQAAVALVGAGREGDTLRLARFLVRNNYPYRLLDIETDAEARDFFGCFQLTEAELPVVVLYDHRVLRNPTTAQLADALGLTEVLDATVVYDLAVVGAGPGGLAAAVYGASEGLSTIVLEALAPGGQAGTSSRIENYLGFPTGITGEALAGRAQVQAQKFGARLAISRTVVSVDCSERPFRLTLDDGVVVRARAIVIASGARYRSLDVPNFARFEGQGIHYAATAMEAQLCLGQEIAIVGGANSAGQAAVFLSRKVAHVFMLVRGEGLAATMSDYLVQRIAASSHITLLTHTEITSLEGERTLEQVTWTSRRTGESTRRSIGNVFAMLGAVPNTDWLRGCVALNEKGFVLTGTAASASAAPGNDAWPFATSIPGIFAVGDVRAGSVKRVASAVGEGSVTIQAVHQYLASAG
jgi:thioredoxin reductase (NADPH)